MIHNQRVHCRLDPTCWRILQLVGRFKSSYLAIARSLTRVQTPGLGGGSMGTCAYCGQTAKATREEVMPLFLSDNRPSYRTVLDHRRRAVRKGRITPVRDVCSKCNGGILSQLDNYASGLDKTYFRQIVSPKPAVEFRFNFDLLLRWLLKLTYNADRTAPPPYEMRTFVPYILGEASEPPPRTTLLLGLISPSVIPKEAHSSDAPEVLEPLSCGVGHFNVGPPADADITLGRDVQINSYLFCVIAWKSTTSRAALRDHVANICRLRKFFELRPRDENITLNLAAMDF